MQLEKGYIWTNYRQFVDHEDTLLESFTLYSMPALIFGGALMSLGSTFPISPVYILVVIHVLLFYSLWNLKHKSVKIGDMRFLLVPCLIWCIALLSGGYHTFPSFYDQAEHLIISNRILDGCDCGILKQHTNNLFRPEVIPGIAAIELFWSGETYRIYFTPLLLLYSTGWAIQHLSEQYVSKKLAFIAPMAFLLLPIVVEYGRTILFDVGVAGMLVSAMVLLKRTDKAKKANLAMLGAMIFCIGMTKYSYLYLGPWILILFIMRGEKVAINPFLTGWGVVMFLFVIKNIRLTGGVFSPMEQQIQGTVISLQSTNGEIGTYGFSTFLLEYSQQWPIVLLLCVILGTVILAKRDPEFLKDTWLLLIPAIILHAIILDFGWVRYSTPWLALACIGLPVFMSSKLFSFHYNERKIKPLFVSGVIIILLSAHQFGSLLVEEREAVKTKSLVHWSIADVYIEAGKNVSDDAIFVTGTSDWNLELYSSITSYQFNNSDDPVYNSIIDFEATHVMTQTRGWRYDVDVNWTYLYGSPIQPFEDYWSGLTMGYLWSVDELRLESHHWWMNQTILLSGEGERFADFIDLHQETTFELPAGTSATRIIQIPNNTEISTAYRAISGGWTSAELLCDSSYDCGELQRSDYLDQRWLVWASQNQ